MLAKAKEFVGSEEMEEEECVGFALNIDEGVQFYHSGCFSIDSELDEKPGWTTYIERSRCEGEGFDLVEKEQMQALEKELDQATKMCAQAQEDVDASRQALAEVGGDKQSMRDGVPDYPPGEVGDKEAGGEVEVEVEAQTEEVNENSALNVDVEGDP